MKRMPPVSSHQRKLHQNHHGMPLYSQPDGHKNVRRNSLENKFGKYGKKFEISFMAGRNIKWFSCHGNQFVHSSKSLAQK